MSHDYRWTPAAQRHFLSVLGYTGSIAEAAASVGKSRQSAHALRRRPDIAGFVIGWDAAVLVARAIVRTEMLEAAIQMIRFTPVRSARNGRTGWRRADPMLRSGMGISLLDRLDRSAKEAVRRGRDAAASVAAQDFEAFLDLIEAGAPRETIQAFLNERDDCRIQCKLPQKSAISDAPKNPALAHSPTCGHPHPRTN